MNIKLMSYVRILTYVLNNINKKNQKKSRFLLVFFIYIFGVSNALGQQISKTLDSIHLLDENDYSNIHLYESLLDHYKKVKNHVQLGSDAHQLAKWIYKEKKIDKAIDVLRTAIEARKIAIPYDPGLLKRSYTNLGYYYELNQNYTKALQTYSKMLAVKESTKFNELVYSRIGGVYATIKDYYTAIEYYKKAIDLCDHTISKKKLISYHIDIAGFYQFLNHNIHYDTIKYHLLIADSLNNSRKKKSIKNAFLINNGLGNICFYGTNKDLQKAKLYYQEALGYAKQIKGNNYYSICYNNLAGVYKDIDSLDMAEQYYLKAIGYPKEYSKHYPYLGLALIEKKRKNYNASQQYFKETVSRVLGYDDFSKPIDSITEEELKKTKFKHRILEILTFRIRALFAQLEDEKDISLYTSIFKTLELSGILVDDAITKDFSYDTKLMQKDLESAINILGLEACYGTGNIEKAFYFMEKSKAVLLTQDIEEQKVSLPIGINLEKTNREEEIENLKNKLLIAWGVAKDSLINVVKEKKHKFANYTDSLAIVYPNYSKRREVPEVLKIQDVDIAKNELVIQYTMSELSVGEVPEAYVMVMSDTDQKLFKLNNIELLLERITKLRELLKHPFKTSDELLAYKTIAHKLYLQVFPEVVRSELLDKKVTIIPDHMLGMLPFEALVTDIETTKYLIEDTEVSYTYSLSFSKENASIERVTDQDFLGVAPINFADGLATLKNSGREIIVANSFYRGDVLLEKEATKENFRTKATSYRILHLATHADAEDTDTIQPWISFAKEKITDAELNTIKNNAELVVLSACNTSLGDVRHGEGALSLARSFFKSGAKSVIPSLWSTNDKAMATITSDFYKNLSEGQTKSAALRAAKLRYLHTNTDAEASPHYWAPLILIGDNGVLLPTTSYDWVWYLMTVILLIVILIIVYRKITLAR